MLISCLLVFILGCNLFQTADAMTFNIGEKIDSDLKIATTGYNPFSSGAIVSANNLKINYTSLIFDGNSSTGINVTETSGSLIYRVYFPIPLFVTNITTKNHFDNGSSNYSFYIYIVNRVDGNHRLCSNLNSEIFFQMNCYIDSVEITIYPNGTNQYYFNDVIINYTALPSNNTELLKEINELKKYINSFQTQINIINKKIRDLKNIVNELNVTINNDGGLVVLEVSAGGSDPVTGATCDGSAMTEATKIEVGSDSNGEWQYTFYHANCTTGSVTLAISYTGSDFVTGLATSYAGADTSDQPDGTGTGRAQTGNDMAWELKR